MSNEPADDAPRQLVGRYQPIAVIATGAIGELWRARIASGPEQGRAVLLRRIPRPAALDGGALERLTTAGFAAMELRHPKIAAVLDVVVAEKEIGVVSEHINGALLQALVRPESGKRANVPLPVAVRIALDVLEAVDGVRAPWAEIFPVSESEEDRAVASGVHGGLVLDDLLIAHFGETMLLEAGLAGVALAIPGLLDQVEVIAYRAPEQLEPKSPIDERADVFTIGAVVWELVAGRSLFGPSFLPRPAAPVAPKTKAKASDASQVPAARRKVLGAPVQRLDALPLLKGKIPKPIADWVARSLERDPAARYPSLRAAIDALSAAAVGVVGTHDAVAKLVATSGAALTNTEEPDVPASLASNRPTVPPVEDGARTARAATGPEEEVESEGVTRRGTAASSENSPAGVRRISVDSEPPTVSIPLSELREKMMASEAPSDWGVESVPPSETPHTPLVVPALAIESVPPPSSGDVETIPPSPVESETLPPFAGVAEDLSATEHTTFAAESVIRAATAEDSTRAASSDAPVEMDRGAGNRKIVWAVMAAALLLVLVGLLRAATANHDDTAPGRSAGAAAGVAVPAETAAALPAEAARALPVGSAKPPDFPSASSTSVAAVPSAGAPTLALPAETQAAPAGTDLAKKPSRRTRYRPTGI